MKTFIFAVLVAIIVVATIGFEGITTELYDYRLKVWKNNTTTLEDRECTTEGLMCLNCRELAVCVFVNNTLVVVHSTECPSGYFCNDSACIKNENFECPPTVKDLKFPCSTPGMFPDPVDCKKYHMCVLDESKGVLEPHEMNCKSSDGSVYGYNARTTFCDQKLCTGKCTGYPIPLCKTTGEVDALRENPTLYYVCLQHFEANVLYPFQGACPNGKIFYPSTRTCQ